MPRLQPPSATRSLIRIVWVPPPGSGKSASSSRMTWPSAQNIISRLADRHGRRWCTRRVRRRRGLADRRTSPSPTARQSRPRRRAQAAMQRHASTCFSSPTPRCRRRLLDIIAPGDGAISCDGLPCGRPGARVRLEQGPDHGRPRHQRRRSPGRAGASDAQPGGHAALDLGDGPRPADDDGASRRADGRGGGKAARRPEAAVEKVAPHWPGMSMFARSGEAHAAQAQLWTEGLGDLAAGARRPIASGAALEEKADRDRRFAAPNWRDNPLFDTIRQTYLLVSERLLGSVDAIEGVDEATREKLRFATTRVRRRDEPGQLRADQPAGDRAGDGDQGREPAQGPRAYAQRPGEGPAHPYRPGAFEVGRNIATTPGKVVKQTRSTS